MSYSPRKLGLCLVLHSRHYVRQLFSRIRKVQDGLGVRLDVLVLMTAAGALGPEIVRRSCELQGLYLVDCRQVDDKYFDFSAYREATSYFGEETYDGVLYVNDTLITKHDSPYLLAALCSRVGMAMGNKFRFPLLIGPYRQSEFSFGDGTLDEFVPTFLFYLNANGVNLFRELLDEMPAIHEAIERNNDGGAEALAPLHRFCRVHALQLRGRYITGDGQIDTRLARKLTTSYCERLLSGRIRSTGLIWHVAGGLFGRLIVPVQVGWSRLKYRLYMRLVGRG